MPSNSSGKKIFVLGFLLFILIGIFVWQSKDLSQGYFDWLKTGIARINPLKTSLYPEIELNKDSGLDFSEVNLEELITERNEQEQSFSVSLSEISVSEEGEEEIIGIGEESAPSEELEQEIVVVQNQDQMTLEEIQQEVDRIAQEVERIDKQVQELIALSGEKINE